ncbi:hypothetical protein S40288_08147 [Stachybotrys chartarum IBT 40288]|nr:hypothetical protein S40288_08147 [Stachybotrys chartarum IBT 40288]
MDSFTNPLSNGAGGFNAARQDRAAAASRQKSCNACVRGKRRCDKRTPRCTRCAAKGLSCVYQKMPPSSSSSSSSTSIASTSTSPSRTASIPSPPQQREQPLQATHQASELSAGPDMGSFDLAAFDMDSMDGLDSLGTDTSPESMHADLDMDLLDPALDFSIVDLMNGTGTGASELWTLPGYGETKLDLPPLPVAPRLPIRDVAVIPRQDECFNDMDVMHAHDPHTRLGWIVKALSEMHVNFTKKLTLPFVHPRQWTPSVPPILMYAFAASMASVNRTPQNKGWSYRLILEAGRDIVREGHKAVTPAEKLARAQALLVVTAIRVFENDLTLKAAGEKDMAVLLGWVEEFLPMIRELGMDNADTSVCKEKPPVKWEDWIMAESMRRTSFVAYAFICLVAILSGNMMRTSNFCDAAFFTASRYVWEAPTAVEFYRAWREKPLYCVREFNFKEIWQYAHPEDMDDFTRMMMTAQVGPDVMEQFLSSDASYLPS